MQQAGWSAGRFQHPAELRLMQARLSLLVSIAVTIGTASAQGQQGSLAPQVRYVDIQNGSDSTGTGTLGNPFRTLSATVGRSDIGSIDVLILLPGVYDEAGGESFPIALPDGLSL